MKDLSIVIPLLNEAENLPVIHRRLTEVLQPTGLRYEIVFVDDGSTDASFQEIRTLAQHDKAVRGVSLSRNFGHQVALTAGFEHSQGEAIISMDADLQHPPEMLPELYKHFQRGYDVVHAIRKDGEHMSVLKRKTSVWFYRLMNYLSDTHFHPGAADFRLVSRRALQAYLSLPEKDRFNRGLFAWIGFNQVYVPYQETTRHAGKSKYTLKKMVYLALDGIISFSARPLQLSFFAGLFFGCAGLLYALFAIVMYFRGQTIEGWTSILVTVLLMGGVQLVVIGILGEYLARIYRETKNRPLYFVKDATDAVDPVLASPKEL
ncbi:dolichol-phosphate mannosyltransferase [Catalinimonas alkaloidigena]|uniref:Dolichol-phosphate mannosyltransferase n=1 Tax=Catalinimonas alkaloidigena TaxID=1075417 RepID=A0A1G8WTR2_9BACT|nr:glycosyltransferase family 2 protein [Catalinimonas alkaloidigena]SDJ81446.1 dolichol-phosphate mannosyltransferase [Catalinimonas alkaloidigena]